MTPKSLNSRYVTLMGVGLLLATVNLLSPTCWGAGASAFNRRPAAADNSILSLQGAAAITQLKKRKLYDSLRAALNAAGTWRGDYSRVTPLFRNEQKLTSSDGAAFDEFGNSVAFSGSTIVVGAPDTIGRNPEQGAAYVFNHHGGGWVEAQKLTASDGAADDLFGWSVAVSGSTIVVGAWRDDIGLNADQGSVYVFNRQGGSWVETQKLTASDGAARDRFGWSVAVSDSTIVVGAQPDRIGGTLFQESAYVFNLQEGIWVEEQRLTASDGGRFDEFGWSVAVTGSTVVVGAIRSSFQGSAYVFNRQGGIWVEEQKLTPSDGGMFDEFGWSVAATGSRVVVSAISTNHFELQGSAYVFDRQGGDWVETQKLTASDGGAADFFGKSVAVNGSTVVVSARGDTIGTNFNQGSAYVFNRQRGKM